jgi:hypothetical protein
VPIGKKMKMTAAEKKKALRKHSKELKKLIKSKVKPKARGNIKTGKPKRVK